MAPCLAQLQKIQVENCALMEEIYHDGEKEKGMGAGTVLIFPQLNSIILQSLPCLASFYYGNGVLDCPYLKKITIIDCPKMEMFISPSLRENVNIKESHKRLGDGDLYPSVKAFFSDKVVFPKLEEIKLVGMDGLKMIWQNDHELHPKSFFSLETLEIKKGGTSLLSIFPGGMFGRRLNNLENLTVSKCESLEVVFDVQTLKNGRESPDEVTATQLSTLHISKLPKLKHVWNKDPHDELVSFENICSVVVKKCPTLTSLFPLSVALGLQELEKLQIKHCEGMEEIVSKMEVGRQEESCRPEFSFPNVTYLQLWGLPELKRFYKESHISEWPELNTLHVCHCENFDVFGPEFQSIQDEACGEEQLHQQPFLSLIKIMPNLEDVCLMSKDIKMIYDQGLVKGTNLKFLDLRCFDDASQVLPVASIERFPNLQKLTVVSSDFKQLFPSQLLSHKTNVKTLARIPELRLESLPEMTHIWDAESYQLNQILQNLESVEVLECHCLINLVPSTRALFPNLTYLDVWRCKQLVKLLASCTANSLMKLTKMRIRECDSLAEIVASDHGDEATRKIEDTVFPKLKRLTLQSLTSLTSFCSATNCNFKFPSLYQVIAADCSKMEFFCQGVLSAPKLEEVRVKKEDEKEKKGRWEGDLNSTLRQLYKEMNFSTVRS